MTESIRAVASGWDVSALQKQLSEHPELWNQHGHRTGSYGPHSQVDDIWVRYREFSEFDGDIRKFHSEPHASVWYPCVAQIPAAWSLARKVRRLAGKNEIAGVLITRVPAGGEVKPHVDHGWHADTTEKWIVQIHGNKEQGFHFTDCELRAETGDVYTFRNDVTHWVTNPSREDRVSLIVCLR